ncbi:valine--tRNA ligase [Candidatus Woesearchaeota archaeon]|nr:valine--tRNA ligase [Candidatus Woesearchaeota archaeon]
MGVLEKGWTKESEEKAWKEWAEKEPYHFSRQQGNEIYSIDTPPPYLNTPIHMGHAATYAIMDMIARYKRMKGKKVLFPLGLDNNGLPIEMAAEKKFGVKLQDTPRQKFLEMCRKVLEESGQTSMTSFQRLGIGFNSWKKGTGTGEIYETDSPDYRAMTQGTFIDLWNKGLIYEDERLNNYCPGCQTTLADSEVERKETAGFLNYVRFKIKQTGEDAVIATTRPELLCTAAVVIYNPLDTRYRHLNGKTAIVPIFNREIPIIEDEEANPEFGTGLVYMSASAGDQDAIRFLRKRNIKPIMAVGKDGLMLEIAGQLQGMPSKKAREKITEMLREKGLLEKQENYTHNVPICERSKHEIEFVAMKEFYVRQVKFKAKLRTLAGKLRFHAPASRQILLDWIDSITIDWPVSRRRYYATEVPLWYCRKCSETIVPEKGKYYQPWREPPPVKSCKCGSTEFAGDERVLDTWFDSSNTPLYILKYEADPKFFGENTPCSIRPQGKEIVRTWLYYTLLKCYLLTGKLIFSEAWIHYHIVDDKGKKMSKSKGNVIDPQEILNKYGAEPLRLWCAMEGNLDSQDFRCSFERIEGAGKTIIKLWNVARFISSFPKPSEEVQLQPLDQWINSEIDRIAENADRQYSQYDFHNPATMIRHFIWETFASHYMELVKNRAYNNEGKFTPEEQQAAIGTLYNCLEKVCLLLAPVNPMITYTIYKQATGKDVHFEPFPKPPKPGHKLSTEAITEANSAIWKAKKDKGLSLKAEVPKATIPKNLKPIARDFILTHNIKEVKWGEELKVEF